MKKAAMFFQIFTIAMCFALIFTECTPIASDGGENPSNPGSPISPSNPSTMSIDEAIAKINALGANETLDVVLGSDTTQAVFANKNAELKTALKNCQGKVKLDMSKTDVTSIMDNAFNDCSSLASVTIGNAVTSIGQFAFDRCISLASVVIPDSVTSIGHYAFTYCNSLANVVIPDSVTSIGIWAFSNCTSLASVTIGNGVTRIEGHVFAYSFSSAASVVIPDSVKYIGLSTFYFCSLTSVNIPDSVTIIQDNAFQGCASLDKINYAGTKNDWNKKITRFGEDWKLYVPARGVTCSDGTTYKFVGRSSSVADSKLGDPL